MWWGLLGVGEPHFRRSHDNWSKVGADRDSVTRTGEVVHPAGVWPSGLSEITIRAESSSWPTQPSATVGGVISALSRCGPNPGHDSTPATPD